MWRVQLLALFIIFEQGCARPTLTIEPDDGPKMYELHFRPEDKVCAVDPTAPDLRSCMTFAEFQGYLHSVRADVEENTK